MPGVVQGQQRAAVLHHGHARFDVSGRDTVVDERFALTLGIECRHVIGSDFELQRGGHAVLGKDAVVLVVLAMRVKVDETRSNHKPLGIDHLLPLQRADADGGDFSTTDADRAHRVQSRLGVDDAAVPDHHVEHTGLWMDGRHHKHGDSDNEKQTVAHERRSENHGSMERRGLRTTAECSGSSGTKSRSAEARLRLSVVNYRSKRYFARPAMRLNVSGRMRAAQLIPDFASRRM